MGQELDLLVKYPRTKRDPAARASSKTRDDVDIARRFGQEFFDGERRHGYGGYNYDQSRWDGVVDDFLNVYEPRSVLDVGCAKGHMLYDFRRHKPKMRLAGIDVSIYAIKNALPKIKKYVKVCNAECLPYEAKEFDLVISINTIHNLPRRGVIKALREIERVGTHGYVTVDAYRTEEQKKAVFDWNLTALTILSCDEWLELFERAGYTGDYSWWMPT
jgi:SAM-dependent methyltransferase